MPVIVKLIYTECMQTTREHKENIRPLSLEATRSVIVERLLAIAEPDSNENLLISQIELSRDEKHKAELQTRFYTELRRHVRAAQRMSCRANYWVAQQASAIRPWRASLPQWRLIGNTSQTTPQKHICDE